MDATETLVTLTDMHLDHTGSILVAVASVDRTLLGTKKTNKQRENESEYDSVLHCNSTYFYGVQQKVRCVYTTVFCN